MATFVFQMSNFTYQFSNAEYEILEYYVNNNLSYGCGEVFPSNSVTPESFCTMDNFKVVIIFSSISFKSTFFSGELPSPSRLFCCLRLFSWHHLQYPNHNCPYAETIAL